MEPKEEVKVSSSIYSPNFDKLNWPSDHNLKNAASAHFDELISNANSSLDQSMYEHHSSSTSTNVILPKDALRLLLNVTDQFPLPTLNSKLKSLSSKDGLEYSDIQVSFNEVGLAFNSLPLNISYFNNGRAKNVIQRAELSFASDYIEPGKLGYSKELLLKTKVAIIDDPEFYIMATPLDDGTVIVGKLLFDFSLSKVKGLKKFPDASFSNKLINTLVNELEHRDLIEKGLVPSNDPWSGKQINTIVQSESHRAILGEKLIFKTRDQIPSFLNSSEVHELSSDAASFLDSSSYLGSLINEILVGVHVENNEIIYNLDGIASYQPSHEIVIGAIEAVFKRNNDLDRLQKLVNNYKTMEKAIFASDQTRSEKLSGLIEISTHTTNEILHNFEDLDIQNVVDTFRIIREAIRDDL